jgi:hypothetical protein
MSTKPLAGAQARIARPVTFGTAIDAVRADLTGLRPRACLETRAPADRQALFIFAAARCGTAGRRLVSHHADGINGGNTAAAVAFEAYAPGVVAVPAGKIRGVGSARYRVAAADRVLTSRARCHNDHSAVAWQGPAIVDDLITAGGSARRCRVRGGSVADRNAGDERSNPPGLFEKPDQAVLIF